MDGDDDLSLMPLFKVEILGATLGLGTLTEVSEKDDRLDNSTLPRREGHV